MVVRNTYRPIDPIELDFPAHGQPERPHRPPGAEPRREPISPHCKSFHAFTKWLRQGSTIETKQLGMAALLNMNTKRLMPVVIGRPKGSLSAAIGALHHGVGRFIWRTKSP
jgi:hypothetical protein